jgi:hypothetical protein
VCVCVCVCGVKKLPLYVNVKRLNQARVNGGSNYDSLNRVIVIVTPAVYPRLIASLHVDSQSTGQKSHCVNTNQATAMHRSALF